LPARKCGTGTAQELGVVTETTQAARVALSDSVEEGVYQFGVEIIEVCMLDGGAIEQR